MRTNQPASASSASTPVVKFRRVQFWQRSLLSVLALGLLSLLAFAPAACADLVIGSTGAGAGQYQEPRGVAVDAETGRLYVTDAGNHRIDVFDSSGGFLFAFGWKVNASSPEEKLQVCTAGTGCQAGALGSGAGQFGRFDSGGIAVDPSSHAVYVTEDNHRLQKFDSEGHFEWMAGGEVDQSTHANLCTAASGHACGIGKVGEGEGEFLAVLTNGPPVAIGPGGDIYVADSKRLGPSESDGFNTRIQRFGPSGSYIGPQLFLAGTVGRVYDIVVDAGGDVYASTPAGGSVGFPVGKYHPDGSAYGAPFPLLPSGLVAALAFDSVENVFLGTYLPDDRTGAVLQYDPAGTQTLALIPAWPGNFPDDLAFYAGALFAVANKEVTQVALPPPGPLLVPGSTKASPLGNVRATLKTTFNPEGKASTVHFQYVDKASFEKGGFLSPNTKTTPESAPTPGGFENQTAAATNICLVPDEATCLKPETTYYFRAFAKNADGEVVGEKAEFTTLAPLQIPAIWATDVDVDSARLHAEVNPLGIHATAHFQYIAEGPDFQAHGFENAVEAPIQPLDFGAGEASLARVTVLFSLQPSTTYHYRLVGSDPYFPPVVSAARTFTTFALPGATETGCPNQAFRTGPSAALPNCRAYELVSPLDKNNGDIRTRVNVTGYPTFLDQSSAAGSDFTYSSYRAFADPQAAPYTNQLLATRGEGGWQSEAITPPRGRQIRLALENPFKAFSADLQSGWFLQEGELTHDPCAPVGFADLYRRISASRTYEALSCAQPHRAAFDFLPELQGFSDDGSHSVFRVEDALTGDASPASVGGVPPRPIFQLYGSSGAGQLRLISVLPSGEANNTDSSAGTALSYNTDNPNRFGSLDHAVSADGSRVFWTAAGDGPGRIYLRTNADQSQSKVAEGKCTQPARACTVAVSATVSPETAFFQKANPQGTRALFTITGPGSAIYKGDLYEFDLEAEPPTSHLIAEDVLEHILGASEDLSRVYFASEEASAQAQAEGAVKGEPNLYLAENGVARFIGTLSSDDLKEEPGITPVAMRTIFRVARASTDGQQLVFASNSKTLSEASAGYDNTDAASGRPDAEVYLYDAAANGGSGRLRCVSCNPSGARPSGREVEGGLEGKVGPWAAATVPRFQSQFYQPRYLSDDGRRVFFNSFEALVLGDTNGRQDVYQWEAVGAGRCTDQSHFYVAGSEGCLGLLSSGQSPEDAQFLDASSTGGDVFFTTGEDLLGQDYGLIDVYDARVEGGFPPPPGRPAACEGEACQGPPEPPEDPTPASAAFEGAGNVVEKPAGRKRHKKKHRRAHRKHQHARSQHRTANENRRASR